MAVLMKMLIMTFPFLLVGIVLYIIYKKYAKKPAQIPNRPTPVMTVAQKEKWYQNKMLELFVSDKTSVDYYRKVFSALDSNGQPKMRATWNWGAFVGSFGFFLYRKEYVATLIVFILFQVCTFHWVSLIILLVLTGLYGNYFIYKSYLKKKNQIESQNKDIATRLFTMRATGGVHGWVLWVSIIMAGLMFILTLAAKQSLPLQVILFIEIFAMMGVIVKAIKRRPVEEVKSTDIPTTEAKTPVKPKQITANKPVDDNGQKVSEEDMKIAILMKNPYQNLGKVDTLNLTLHSPMYKIYELLLENGMQKKQDLALNQLIAQIKKLSNVNEIKPLLQAQENVLLKHVISIVQTNRKKLLTLDPSLPADIFSIDQPTVDFLKKKISSFSEKFYEDLKQLQTRLNELAKHNTVDLENVLTYVIRLMSSQLCYKKVDDICLLSALNLVLDSHASKSEETMHAFSEWARQYDHVYLESLKEYKQPLDLFNKDIVSVITHNYESAHNYFMGHKERTSYIEYIKNTVSEAYFDKELVNKQAKVNGLNKLFT